jgi:hypothetical protein
MFIHVGSYEVVLCLVGPESAQYGKMYPVWTLYTDGSFSRQYGKSYFRSPANKIRKPFGEYTINDLREILINNESPT